MVYMDKKPPSIDVSYISNCTFGRPISPESQTSSLFFSRKGNDAHDMIAGMRARHCLCSAIVIRKLERILRLTTAARDIRPEN